MRPWIKPWNAEHAACRTTKPLRHNGQPYSGINIIMLWQSAIACGYNAPIWMTFRQARELGACVETDLVPIGEGRIVLRDASEARNDQAEGRGGGRLKCPLFLCAPGRAHSLGGESPLHTRHGEVLAEGKGSPGDWRSEGSWKQSAGATNRKRMRGVTAG